MTEAKENTASDEPASSGERHQFQAEVSRLLNIVANSLYSEKEIFLRELISNASDACDKLRYASLTNEMLGAGDSDYRIEIKFDKEAKTLTVLDNGIGLDYQDLIDNLGTIARSGTAAFVDSVGAAKKEPDEAGDVSLIGQFGVGFYSAFMVANEVLVTTRKAGDDKGWRWRSDGLGEFTIVPTDEVERGAEIVLHLKNDAEEYLDAARLRHIVKTYSDHISFPIALTEVGGGEDSPVGERLNQASAIWARPKAEVDEEAHKEFYHHVSHAVDDPWMTLHFRAEGVMEYAGLLYVPSMRPFDIFHPERKCSVKLYVKRVFITSDCEHLLPSWLRFLRGVIDSEDLPLNVSRELLQNSPILARIKAGVTSRVLNELAEKAEKEADAYAGFWEAFGPVLKEGLYEDFEHRDKLMKLARFHSTASDNPVGLEEYVGRMKEGQEGIYYISGDDIEAIRRSPQLEGFQAKGIEVLLMTDPIDEFWVPTVGVFETTPFKSVTRGGADLEKIKIEEDEGDKLPDAQTEGMGSLIALIKLELGEAVQDVRESNRLTDSAVCLVAGENDLDMNLQRLLKQQGQLDAVQPRVLELNPKHSLIMGLAARAGESGASDSLKDAAHLLLDQARIVEGEPVTDPSAYAQRMSEAMASAFGTKG
ncbi:MAG: molecular chaperone HtpG [Pseudomonadota bacterium]|nr:molecular chaperone HtpG [Pseudomonadota bacterium]